ncbi:MAG: tetratricopeptide repeat protein [Acidobacteriota bacterium]|nr:tetratricopeptide repeat protein [Acidobacteriota bacterium]MDE3263383.1 tetratricopeptide repeat protein [Acidobacteriota bacterium]
MKTMSRATVLTLVWLMVGPGLPIGDVPEGAAQTVESAPAEVQNLDRAIAAQRKLVSEQTGSADRASALNDLANLLELRGDVEGAFEHYFAAIAEDGAWAPAHYNLALLAYTTGDSELASTHLEAAIELDPENAWAHYQLGRIADDAGDAEAAVDHYVRALSLDTRLAFTDVNPHFAVNRYATEVLLKADRSRVEALPPRTYSEPGRISGLLLPMIEEEAAAADAAGAADAVEAAEATETPEPERELPRRASRVRGPEDASADGVRRVIQSRGSLPAGDQPVDRTFNRAAAVETVEREWPTADTGRAAAAPERQSDDARAGERPRVFTRQNLRSRTLGSGRMVPGIPYGTVPEHMLNQDPRGGVRPGTAVGPGGRQPSPPAAGTFRGNSGRFQPSTRSSAQLETTIRRHALPAP